MIYYTIQNNVILTAENKQALSAFYKNIKELPLDYEKGKYIVENNKLILNPNYKEEKTRLERERLDMLSLTAADVERAIYKDKGIDFEDIVELVKNNSEINVKALKIELKANNFYRGNPYINQIGAILGYSSKDLDYLFENKELPVKVMPDLDTDFKAELDIEDIESLESEEKE